MTEKRVYITSYPRSGNTWVRLLLEYSLGIVTETMPAEDREFWSGLTGGDRHITQNDSVHLIKTHAFAVIGDDPVIYVLRDGRDACVSYWHFMSEFRKQPPQPFSQFLRDLYSAGDWWPDHVHHWLMVDRSHPKIIVRFEDLLQSQEKELDRMIGFLGIEPARKFDDFKNAVEFQRLNQLSRDFFRSGRVGERRTQFTEQDNQFFSDNDWGTLGQLGYESGEGHSSRDFTKEREGWIRRYADLDRQLYEKQSEIKLLNRECQTRLREIENMAPQLEEKEREISNLTQVAELRLKGMDEKERVILEQSLAAKECSRMLAEKEKEIDRLRALCAQLGKGASR